MADPYLLASPYDSGFLDTGDGNRIYYEQLGHPADWLAWEDAVVSDEPNGVPGMYSDREIDARIAMVRICAHFFSHGSWLEEDQLLRNAHKLAGIPAVLVHGRHDMGCPVQTPWELAKVWPDARLHIIEDSGHAGSDALALTVRAAIEEFKNR